MDDKPKKLKLTPKERARNARMRAHLRGSKRIDLMLDREAAIALSFLRKGAGTSSKPTISVKAIIERLLLAERERVLRS